MPVQVIAIVLALLGCLAFLRNPGAALAWIILLPMFFDKRPWWLERKKLAIADLPATVAGLVAILTVAIRAPMFPTMLAYALALVCVIVRVVQIRREKRPA